MGVNLPAHLVIIKSTQAWRGAGLNYQEYSTSSLLQMMGRAGRPQFDTSGVAVIMTHVSTAQRYQRISAGGEPVESTLLSSLVEHLASEICLGTVQSLSAATAWLRSTFLYIRVRSNPRHYKLLLPQQSGDLDAAVDQHMRTQLTPYVLVMKKSSVAEHALQSTTSPKLPHTMEALLVHYVDDLDSKVNSILGIIAADQNPGEWTQNSRMYERAFMKPGVKPEMQGTSPGIA